MLIKEISALSAPGW